MQNCISGEGKSITLSLAEVGYADLTRMEPVDADILSDFDLLGLAKKNVPEFRNISAESVLAASKASFSERAEVNAARVGRILKTIEQAHVAKAAQLRITSAALNAVANDPELFKTLIESAAADAEIVKLWSRHTVFAQQVAVVKESLRVEEAALAKVKAGNQKALEEKAAIEAECRRLRAEADKELELLGFIPETADRLAELKGLSERTVKMQCEIKRLERLERDVLERVNRASERAQRYGEAVLPEEIIQSISVWNDRTEALDIAERARAVSGLSYDGPKGKALAAHLAGLIRKVRPYDENTALNLFICYVQNFLTVFAGAPGCGKTSICRLMADALGLTSVDARFDGTPPGGRSLSRFVNVPVEYGWTTKRDFIGYRNPLTGRFESPDPARWGLIRQLDAEANSEVGSVYPAMMLLDEANLSPMEYYWADFMRLCDGNRNPGIVTLQSSGPSAVPDTLRFVATINSDATTETLSPRLIDRAAVITLPVPTTTDMQLLSGTQAKGPLIPWSELQSVFAMNSGRRISDSARRMLGEIEAGFGEVGIRLSPRSRAQVDGFVATASSLFVDNGRSAQVEAFDFAVMQKLLPRINGTGDQFRGGLEAIRDLFVSRNLVRSAGILTTLIDEGMEMDSYKFF